MSPAVRTALATDAAAIAAVRIASWRATYGEHLPAHVWDDDDVESVTVRFAASIGDGRLLALVASDEAGVVCGYALYGPARDDDLPPGTGEVYAIYVRPDSWSTGAGRALLADACRELGGGPVALWVLEANARARRFYEIAGFTTDGAIKPADLPGGVRLPEVRYRRG